MKDFSLTEALDKLFKWRDPHTTLRVTVTGISAVNAYSGIVFVAPNVVDSRVFLAAGASDLSWGFDLADASLIRGDEDVLEITIDHISYMLTPEQAD
jgi:hypothetical protein